MLPIKVAAMAGAERIGVLTATAIWGAIAASLSNIVFGWLSDRSVARRRGRRSWMLLGAMGLVLAYGLILEAGSAGDLIVAIMLFQCAVNAILAPLLAIFAEEIPDAQKGLMAGLMAWASPAASALAALVVTTPLTEAERLGVVAAVAIACLTPFALIRSPLRELKTPSLPSEQVSRYDLMITWSARLLVQVAGNVLALYLVYYFESIAPNITPAVLAAQVSQALALAYIASLPIALLIGILSDRLGQRKPFLLGASILMTAGLLVMAIASDPLIGTIGFGINVIGMQVFVNLHAAVAMQVLPDRARCGRDLGLLNLANTLPAVVGPALTWLLATPQNFTLLMVTLALLALLGGMLMIFVRSQSCSR
ncbi:MFS transporter [Sphingomonas xinjiangensis]|nr:MFS transporter [Sphingomonas xinjiangensis]